GWSGSDSAFAHAYAVRPREPGEAGLAPVTPAPSRPSEAGRHPPAPGGLRLQDRRARTPVPISYGARDELGTALRAGVVSARSEGDGVAGAQLHVLPADALDGAGDAGL